MAYIHVKSSYMIKVIAMCTWTVLFVSLGFFKLCETFSFCLKLNRHDIWSQATPNYIKHGKIPHVNTFLWQNLLFCLKLNSNILDQRTRKIEIKTLIFFFFFLFGVCRNLLNRKKKTKPLLNIVTIKPTEK